MQAGLSQLYRVTSAALTLEKIEFVAGSLQALQLMLPGLMRVVVVPILRVFFAIVFLGVLVSV